MAVGRIHTRVREINEVVLGGIIEGVGEGVALAMSTGKHNADSTAEVAEATDHIGWTLTASTKQSLDFRNVGSDNDSTAHNLQQEILVVNIKQCRP